MTLVFAARLVKRNTKSEVNCSTDSVDLMSCEKYGCVCVYVRACVHFCICVCVHVGVRRVDRK